MLRHYLTQRCSSSSSGQKPAVLKLIASPSVKHQPANLHKLCRSADGDAASISHPVSPHQTCCTSPSPAQWRATACLISHQCCGVLLQITIIKGKVEEVELPVQKVDVIISEVRSPSHQRLPLATGLSRVVIVSSLQGGHAEQLVLSASGLCAVGSEQL